MLLAPLKSGWLEKKDLSAFFVKVKQNAMDDLMWVIFSESNSDTYILSLVTARQHCQLVVLLGPLN